MRVLKIGLMAAMTLAAFVGSASAQSQLRIGLAEDPDALDPTFARTFVGRIVFASLCDKLFDIDASLKIVPQLATGYEWSGDNKALTIKLRQGVVFHDGEPMNAAAVKYSLDRHLKALGSNRRVEISAVTAVDVVDDSTVKLTLSSPFAPLLAQLTDRAGMIVSPKAAEVAGDKFSAKPICAGPFKFVERVAQDRIVLEKFDKYWDKDKIKVDKITFLPVPDNAVRLANLRSGQLDIIERVTPTDLASIRGDNRIKDASIVELGYQGITLNLNNGPQSKNPLGQDVRVRQAFELALDRKVISDVVFSGEWLPGNQWVPSTSPYYVKSVPIPGRDVAKAKALLKEAGVTNVSITMMVPNQPEPMQVAQVIQSMEQEAGIEIKLIATEFARSIDLAEKGEFQSYFLAWSGRTDPDGNLYVFAATDGTQNYGKYSNATVDKEIVAARTTANLADRLADYTKVAEQTSKDLPIIYLYHRKWIYAYSTKLNGFTPVPDGLIRPQGLTMN